MIRAPAGFVTICPKKEVELGADKHLHRADHAAELKQEIQFETSTVSGNQYAYLPGGAVRAINPNSSMTLAETSNCIAVFKGNLLNKAELALQVTGCPAHVTEAQLLLHLYEAMGIDMLSRLNGQYAFCLYDSKQARVLAARDHSGVIPLLEGRTAAGSLIIACGTFLPEGTSQMTEIRAGEYKYGWHALPRPFKCGHRIISGRASCDYGIRRRSIDAYNAPPARESLDLPRQSSLDIPRQRHAHHAPTSHSYTHTPGRYMPPHIAAAHAGGSGAFSRQRATSFDGHHLQQHSSNSSTPAAGRRRSETSTHQVAKHSGQQQQHHHHHHQQQWVPRSPGATPASPAAAASAAKPAPIQITPAKSSDSKQLDEAITPVSETVKTPGSATSSEHHRRRRRHHKRRSNKASSPAATAADDDAHSEADSQVSSGTHDSGHSAPPAAQSPGAACEKAAVADKDAAGPRKMQEKQQPAPGSASEQQQQVESRVSGGSGFKRNGSCGELAALGASSAPHAVLLAVPQGLAC